MLQSISGLVAQVINYQGFGLIKCGSEERRFESSQDLFSLKFFYFLQKVIATISFLIKFFIEFVARTIYVWNPSNNKEANDNIRITVNSKASWKISVLCNFVLFQQNINWGESYKLLNLLYIIERNGNVT